MPAATARERGIDTAISVGPTPILAPHSFSSPPHFPLAPTQQLNKLLKPFTCPTRPRLYIFILARHHALGILSLRRMGSRRRASAPCWGHWQQRQLGCPLQQGGGPAAEVSGQPIENMHFHSLQLHFAALGPTR